jgi:hypothetical protein
MDVSDLKSWVPATLVRANYHVKIKKASAMEGSNPDDAGKLSTGLKLVYQVLGPETEQLTNGASCLGFSFDENLWRPRASASPKGIDMMNGRIKNRIVAAFGKDFPAQIEPTDWENKEFMVSVKSQFDEFRGQDVPVISRAWALDES